MTTLILTLSIFLGVLSVINKVLLAQNKRAGWASGVVIGLFSSVYFFLIGLKILACAEVGFLLVMAYGYVSHVETRPSDRTRLLNIMLTGVLLVLSIFLFTGELTIYQLVSSLSFIWGGYALAVHRRTIAWCLFLAAHVATSAAGYLTAQFIFSGLQVISAIVCLYVLVAEISGGRPQRAT